MKYYTAVALGRVLGIGEERVKALANAGVIREGRKENGLFLLEQSAREIIAELDKPGERKENVDYSTERARLMQVKRKNAEHDLALREKDLHTTEDIETVVAGVLANFRARIRAIPVKAAPECAKLTGQEDVYELLKKMTDEALTELADIERVFAEKGSDGDGKD